MVDQNKAGQSLNVSVGLSIKQKAIKNLLSAHKRIADSGNAVEIIKQPKYILRLAKKRKQVLTQDFQKNGRYQKGKKKHWQLFKENLGNGTVLDVTLVFSD